MTPEERLLVAEAKAERLRADIDALERSIRLLQDRRTALTNEQFQAWGDAEAARQDIMGTDA